MNRVTARTHAMKLIYEWEMGGEGGEDTRIDLLGVQPGEEESAFMERMFSGVVENAAEIDPHRGKRLRLEVGAHLPRRSGDPAPGDLRTHACKTPQAVVINEAVEMARQYSGEKSPQFVHGVLGSISRSLAQ